ncbi:MAG TPA: hypothetical protein VLR69_05985 [Thermoanaerobaculia bacterium]|nr:hypothetical protein [Thermoanaerobaculia bacterium]
MSWRRIGLVGLLPLLLAGSAGAQAPGRLNVVLEGEAGARDDGNYGLQQDQALQQSRTVGRAGFNLQLSYALERLSLALGYSPYYERTLDGSGLSGTTHRLDFGLVGDLNRQLRLNVRENLISTPDIDLYAPVTTTETTVVTRHGNQLSHLLDVSLDQTFGRHASMILGVTHSLRRYEDVNLYDSETLGGRLGAAFELARGSRVEAALGVARYDYRQRGSSDVRTVGVAYATDLGRDNHLRVEAGAYSEDSTLRPVISQVDGFTAVRESDTGWRGGLQFARDERLFHWTLGASHDISPGAGLGRAVTADNGFLGLSTAIGRRLTLGLDGNVSRQRDLPHQGPAGTSDSQTLTRFAAGTVRAGWSFAPAVRLEGGYSRIWQRAQVAPFANLSYSRYYMNLAFRLYSSGETPLEPASLGRPTTDEKSDHQ